MMMFVANETVSINTQLIITVLVIIALALGILWLWRHR